MDRNDTAFANVEKFNVSRTLNPQDEFIRRTTSPGFYSGCIRAEFTLRRPGSTVRLLSYIVGITPLPTPSGNEKDVLVYVEEYIDGAREEIHLAVLDNVLSFEQLTPVERPVEEAAV